jgi:hypothetical protein
VVGTYHLAEKKHVDQTIASALETEQNGQKNTMGT